MDFDIKLESLGKQPVMAVRTRTTMNDLPRIIGQTYMRIADHLAGLGVAPVDAPYTAYFNIDMDDLDVEMGFPTKEMQADEGDIKAGEIPAGDAAVCLYKGAYSGMIGLYEAMFKWIGEQGRQPSGVYYEYYFNSPAEVPESELLTKVVMPLI